MTKAHPVMSLSNAMTKMKAVLDGREPVPAATEFPIARMYLNSEDADEMINGLDEAEPELGHLGFVPSVGVLGDEELKEMADATLEPLRECLLPLACEADALPTIGVSGFVADLAKRHGITYTRTGLEDWADSVAKVLGDYVEMDETDRLLVALKKAGVIDGRQVTRLLANHYRDMKGPD